MLSVQLIICELPACQFSPPFGDTTVITPGGGVKRIFSEVFMLEVDREDGLGKALKNSTIINSAIRL